MPVINFPAHSLLSAYVHGFSVTERMFAPPASSFDILPDSMLELVFCGQELHIVADDGSPYPLPGCFLVGLLQQPLRIRALGLVRTLRVRLWPWAVAELLGAELQAGLAGVAGVLQLSESLHRLVPAVAAALETDAAAAVALVQEPLLDRALTAALPDPTLAQAARQIIGEKGDLSIEALAQAAHISPRALRRKFQGLLGLGPKALARVSRFEAVRDGLWENPDADLAELALAAGYADQAHMQREFRQFSQRTPRQFAAQMRETRRLFGNAVGVG
ncbi:MAG: AraC family transcriptional regulator [Chloroflexaceae bacterium]|jgi:AraC-like DNA-binding protein|nr:AraC family transcriptional regulator [Chloroflexaceae bacterium]